MSTIVSSDILEVIRDEYEEMPELRLTLMQAARLWDLDLATARALLDEFVREGFLTRTPAGRYERRDAC